MVTFNVTIRKIDITYCHTVGPGKTSATERGEIALHERQMVGSVDRIPAQIEQRYEIRVIWGHSTDTTPHIPGRSANHLLIRSGFPGISRWRNTEASACIGPARAI
ncbi:hypothetical protein BDV59DRAFT_166166 [Aspergillus ambiguus]|uniref:uncharacterized protein n=1 Tax=Aspergillus ambiguus TaxID=176160 RepID=UPI003CCD7A7A